MSLRNSASVVVVSLVGPRNDTMELLYAFDDIIRACGAQRFRRVKAPCDGYTSDAGGVCRLDIPDLITNVDDLRRVELSFFQALF